ncbi:MAG: L-type lectin-domain containing protein [Verrucomicrobiota bacterium]
MVEELNLAARRHATAAKRICLFLLGILPPALALQARAQITGFGGDGSGWTLNGHDFFNAPTPAKVNGNVLTITESTGFFEARSAFYDSRQNITQFNTSFTYQELTPSNAGDGFVFVLQNMGTSAVGPCCAQLGFDGLSSATGVAFHIYASPTETGYAPTTVPNSGTGNYLSTAPLNLASGNPIAVTITYDGSTLSESLLDTVTHQQFSKSFPVDLVDAVGGELAYVGFTGSTGAAASDQRISDFSFTSVPEPATSGLIVAVGLCLVAVARQNYRKGHPQGGPTWRGRPESRA